MRINRSTITAYLSILAVVIFIAAAVMAEGLDDVLSKVNSPEELESFYANEGFKTIFKISGKSQSIEETLRSKLGNCDDYTRLTDAVLKKLGVESEIVIIKFKKMKIGHAICAWKEGGKYSYFDNLKIVRTASATIQELTETDYSDFECCTACEPKYNTETGACE